MAISNPRNHHGTGAHMDALHSELVQLRSRYGAYLKDEAIQGDVECLTTWIEAYQQGSREASEYLHEYGSVLLENISNRLKAASLDQQRLDEESPASKHSTGHNAHQLSRAIALATHAGEDLDAAMDTKTNH